MSYLDFYLFDVGHGQCAAARLPNRRWCLFDLGASSDFSPIDWISPMLNGHSFLKTTVSHLHGDHLMDIDRLAAAGSNFLLAPAFDMAYLNDAVASSSSQGADIIRRFAGWYYAKYIGTGVPEYGGLRIRELSLTAAESRALGGSANTRVNNTSIVTRLDFAGRSILLCGDMESSGWEAVLGEPFARLEWAHLVSGVDVLVAPHHGHKSGFSEALMALAKPDVVLVSVQSRDPSVDSRYSGDRVESTIFELGGRRRLTTRTDGHIRVTVSLGAGTRGTLEIATNKEAPPMSQGELMDQLLQRMILSGQSR